MQVDWLIKNVNLATMRTEMGVPYGQINNAVLAVTKGKISWFGDQTQAPEFPDTHVVIDGHGGWITPGLIDCHTHLIYAGSRAAEFEQRQKGISYEEIAISGGGINSTVAATRAASNDELFQSALHRLKQLHAEGVTTVEIKSGYGLDIENEKRMLRIARSLEDHLHIKVMSTFLGAHTLPTEFNNRSDDYIDHICNEMMPAIANEHLADAVDIFCESIGFSYKQTKRVFQKAKELGLAIKGHVGQLSDMQGAGLVAEFEGLSADHLEYISLDQIKQMKEADVVAVLLPAAFYYLKEQQHPPTAAFRNAGVPMAVASDCNPGSAPVASLRIAMNQACILFGLTPEEVLLGTTRYAAKALGLEKTKGVIRTGYDADLILWDIEHPAELSYSMNMIYPSHIWVNGKHVQTS